MTFTWSLNNIDGQCYRSVATGNAGTPDYNWYCYLYTYYTGGGTTTFTVPDRGIQYAEFIMVGGGGGGGYAANTCGGGGGGGGVIYIPDLRLAGKSICNINLGAPGATVTTSYHGYNGADTQFVNALSNINLIAKGGGGGGTGYLTYPDLCKGYDGGCGGGAAWDSIVVGQPTQGSSSEYPVYTGRGYPGGLPLTVSPASYNYPAGGGGGAAETGIQSTSTKAGNGGAGFAHTILAGVTNYWGCGGGAGCYFTAANRGFGGSSSGGNGAYQSVAAATPGQTAPNGFFGSGGGGGQFPQAGGYAYGYAGSWGAVAFKFYYPNYDQAAIGDLQLGSVNMMVI